MSRPIVPGEKRALNKRVVELLADRLHEMELNAEPNHRLWAYRKAAWAVEDMAEDIGLLHRTMGLKGLQAIPDVGQTLGADVEGMLAKAQQKWRQEMKKLTAILFLLLAILACSLPRAHPVQIRPALDLTHLNP